MTWQTWHRLERAAVQPDQNTLNAAGNALGIPVQKLLALLQSEETTDTAPEQLLHWLAVAQKRNTAVSAEKKESAEQLLQQRRADILDALNWCAATRQEIQSGLALAGEMVDVWVSLGDFSAERACLAKLLRGDKTPIATPERARALRAAGILAAQQMDYAAERSYFEQCIAIWRDLEDYKERLKIVNALGMSELLRGNYESAWGHFERFLDAGRQFSDVEDQAKALNNMGLAASGMEKFALASILHEEARALYEKLESKNIVFALVGSGQAFLNQGNPERAEGCFTEALRKFIEIGGSDLQIAPCLENLAYTMILKEEADPKRAAFLFGAAESIRFKIGMPLSIADREAYERYRSLARQRLGLKNFMELRETGSKKTPAEAVEYLTSVSS